MTLRTPALHCERKELLSHARYYKSELIAQPHAAVVQQISTLRDIVVSPPETLRVLQPHRWVAADFSDKHKLDAADSADRAKYQEPSDRAIFLARTVSVQEPMDAHQKPIAWGTARAQPSSQNTSK